jgi:dihydrofolate reductase
MGSKIGAIIAVTDEGVFGKGLGLPWPHGAIKGDLPHFKRVTQRASIVMGKNTHASLPGPLPERVSFVVSTSLVDGEEGGAIVCKTLECALEMAGEAGRPIWLIGGASLLGDAMTKGVIDQIWVTRVHHSFDGDVTIQWGAEFLSAQGYVLVSSEDISDGLATKEFWEKQMGN